MNIEQTANVLAKAAAIDNRNQSDAAILAWHEIIGDLDYRDALNAVAQHRRESDAYLMPVHIRRIAEKLRTERQDRERRDEQHLALEAYAATAGPLTDRSAEIRAFVGQVRDVLPDGDLEALAPRHEHWRREHHAYQRQLAAEPNPDFNPGMRSVATWQASKHEPAGAWWENDAKREAHATEILAAARRLHPRPKQTEEIS
jgi:hypothetical protein